jgi:hypothetical protein
VHLATGHAALRGASPLALATGEVKGGAAKVTVRVDGHIVTNVAPTAAGFGQCGSQSGECSSGSLITIVPAFIHAMLIMVVMCCWMVHVLMDHVRVQ